MEIMATIIAMYALVGNAIRTFKKTMLLTPIIFRLRINRTKAIKLTIYAAPVYNI